MKRSAIVLTLLALFYSGSLAQERETRTREGQRGGERDRREYGRGRLGVEDPAGFKTEGEQIFSGPQPGEKLPAFKATSLDGDKKGKELDPITSAGDKLQVLFFQDVSRVAIAGLFSVMDAIGKIERKTDKDLQIACVFLIDDADRIKKGFARGFPALLELGIDVVAVSQGGRDGPGAYGLNRTISQTIILARDGKVTRNFVFPEPLLYADPHVMGGVAELIDEKRETVAAWLNEAAASERPRAGEWLLLIRPDHINDGTALSDAERQCADRKTHAVTVDVGWTIRRAFDELLRVRADDRPVSVPQADAHGIERAFGRLHDPCAAPQLGREAVLSHVPKAIPGSRLDVEAAFIHQRIDELPAGGAFFEAGFGF